MRDIRGDLQDRAGFLEEQIGAAQTQFEKRMELFEREHESKIADLQAELEAVNTLMEREYRRIMSVPDIADGRRQAQGAPVHETPAIAAEGFDEPEYLEDEPERLPEEPHYREPTAADLEPIPHAEPLEEVRPAKPDAEAPYAARSAHHDDADHPQEAAPEPRSRRPIPMERPAAARRPVETPQHRPNIRAGGEAEASSKRTGQPSRYEPVQRDRGPTASQKQPLADFLIRKLGEVGTMTLDDLCGVAVREGYFAAGDNPDRAVQMTLTNVVKAGFIRQMPNGTFSPASVMDTIRLRRAI